MPIIEIKSFGPFKEARLEWSAGQTVMIVGANGLGKSFLTLALQQLLTGTHYLSEDTEADNIVHYGQTGYRLAWQDEDFEIVESRENDSPKCEFWQNGKLYEGRPNGSKGNRVSEHRQALDSLFGLSGLTRKQAAEIFLRRVLISPETSSLFNMRDAELTSYLLAAFNVDGVKERRREIMDEKNKLKNELDGVQKVKAPDLKVENEVALQIEIDKLKELIAGVNPPSMLPKMQAELLRYQQQLNGMFAEREAMLAKYLEYLEQNKKFQNVNIQELACKLGQFRHPLLLADLKGEKIREKSRLVQSFENQYGHIQKRIKELKTFVDSDAEFLNSDKRDLWSFRVREIESEIDKIKAGKMPLACPVCKGKQVLKCGGCGSNFQIEFGRLVKFDSVKDDRSKLESERGELISHITMIDARLELDKKQEEWSSLVAVKGEKLAKLDAEYKALEAELAASEKLMNDWDSLDQAKSYNQTQKNYNELLAEVTTEKRNTQQQIDNLLARMRESQNAVSKFTAIDALNERLITSKANRAALAEYAKSKAQVDRLEAEILDYERVIKDLPIFMRQQISQKSGLLAHRANLILNQIGGKGDIRFNPGDDEEIKKIIIEQQQFGVWNKIRTGGSSYSEQRLIAFSLLLAQHELYDNYFKPVDLVIQDDIFAGVDANRQELLARGVRNVSKSTQIILTSYNVEQWVNPDRLYRLVKADDDSTILKEE